MDGCTYAPRYGAAVLLLCASLAACGGGGGSPTPATTVATPVATASTTPGVTTASGTLVDDATGNPLAGARVVLMPWGPCSATPVPSASIGTESDGCPTPLPSPQVTTAANGAFTLGGVPNGHYVLVIGSDAQATPPAGYAPPACTSSCGTPTPAPFTVQATVHDNVTLSGGVQTLVAPTLPTVPAGYTVPVWEKNGDYRLATLDAQKEMPCYIAWQYERAQNRLAGASVDEWLTEAVRAQLAYVVANNGGTESFLTTGNSSISGGTSCDSWLQGSNTTPTQYASDPRALWFGGDWFLWEKSGTAFYQGLGLAQFPIDPRSFTDPNHPVWP